MMFFFGFWGWSPWLIIVFCLAVAIISHILGLYIAKGFKFEGGVSPFRFIVGGIVVLFSMGCIVPAALVHNFYYLN